MYIFMLSEENHGFLGAFSNLEKAIEGAKEWIPLNRPYKIEEVWKDSSWEIDFSDYCLMTIDKITLDKLEY